MQQPFAAFASCQPGLEPLLAGELAALGLPGEAQPGGVAFAADVPALLRGCRWLGTASHVLLRLAEFPCRALGELERKAGLLPWPRWLRGDVPAAVHATARSSRVYHSGAIEQRVARAIGAAFAAPMPELAPAAETAARVHVRFHRDRCTISLDATCTPLHRRGYRLDAASAPLREDLAHALLLAGRFSGHDALLDPFCGSGTIAIEAAGLALGLPPGRLRPPPLAHLALFDAGAWAAETARPGPRSTPAPVVASDRDAGAIEAARDNAGRAGVAAAIEFHVAAFTAHPWLQDPGTAPARGLLATNPPFGVRLGRGGDLAPLYQTLGHRAAKLPAGWRWAVLAHDVRLARRTGLPLRAAFTTRHGGLSVTALAGAPPPG
ncbi:MAG: class I SAM-dependent RNA methyltransferase [Planctomycetes bacterium]|nr:class I SAM-dependent RNA methyltransferase [Planctomycetota bacterium]